MAANKNSLLSIQYLRAIAALMVVLHHARNPKDWLFNPLEGYSGLAWGVDVFFVISGFIMYAAARHEEPIEFLGRRLIRVVPLYWLALITLLLINTRMQFWNAEADVVVHVIKSMLFIPQYSLVVPGEIFPYLISGWTLNYEMLFYVVFCVGLMWRRPLVACTLAILALFIGGLVASPQSVVLKAYTQPILLEFLLGVWIAWLHSQGRFKVTAPWVIVVGFAMLMATPWLADPVLTMASRIVSSALILIGALLLGDGVRESRLLKLLGDASYSIYLTHEIISLRLCSKFWHAMPLDGPIQFVGWVVLVVCVSCSVGVAIHLYLEKPVLGVLRARLDAALQLWRTRTA